MMFDVDLRTIARWQSIPDDPLPVAYQGKRGTAHQYNIRAVHEWGIRRRFSEINPGGTGEVYDLEAERARLAAEQADNMAMKNAVLRNELASVDMIRWTLNNVGGQIAALLEAIPQRVKRRVPDLSARHIDIIKGEIVKAQNTAARISVDLDEYKSVSND